VGGHQPALELFQFLFMDDRERRDAPHLVLRCQARDLVGIDFQDQRLARFFVGDLFELGRSHATWTTPWGPEVDENGNRCRRQNLGKALPVFHIDGDLGRRKDSVAFSTFAGICQAGNGYSVRGTTGWTGNQHKIFLSRKTAHRIGHDKYRMHVFSLKGPQCGLEPQMESCLPQRLSSSLVRKHV